MRTKKAVAARARELRMRLPPATGAKYSTAARPCQAHSLKRAITRLRAGGRPQLYAPSLADRLARSISFKYSVRDRYLINRAWVEGDVIEEEVPHPLRWHRGAR